MKKVLIAEKIGKKFTYPQPRLLFQDLSLSVSEGESLAITGPSGVGKTTLLQAAMLRSE